MIKMPSLKKEETGSPLKSERKKLQKLYTQGGSAIEPVDYQHRKWEKFGNFLYKVYPRHS